MGARAAVSYRPIFFASYIPLKNSISLFPAYVALLDVNQNSNNWRDVITLRVVRRYSAVLRPLLFVVYKNHMSST